MPSPVKALLDSNVLYSSHLRNLLLQMAQDDRFDIRWSEHIEREWLGAMETCRSVRRDRGAEVWLRVPWEEAKALQRPLPDGTRHIVATGEKRIQDTGRPNPTSSPDHLAKRAWRISMLASALGFDACGHRFPRRSFHGYAACSRA